MQGGWKRERTQKISIVLPGSAKEKTPTNPGKKSGNMAFERTDITRTAKERIENRELAFERKRKEQLCKKIQINFETKRANGKTAKKYIQFLCQNEGTNYEHTYLILPNLT